MSFRTKAGCNVKTPKINQDIVIVDQKLPHNIQIFCICDGHGSNGHLVAAFIKYRLLGTFDFNKARESKISIKENKEY